MKVTITMDNEERKHLQRVENIKDPQDLKAYFANSINCEPEDGTQLTVTLKS